jgi:hypothetical protein
MLISISTVFRYYQLLMNNKEMNKEGAEQIVKMVFIILIPSYTI